MMLVSNDLLFVVERVLLDKTWPSSIEKVFYIRQLVEREIWVRNFRGLAL